MVRSGRSLAPLRAELSLVAALASAALAPAASAQSLTRVPGIGGRQVTESSDCFGIAPDRSAMFLNAPDEFVAGDANGQYDVVEFDLATGVHTIVVHALGGGSPDDSTFGVNLSSGGNRLVIHSDATNLVAGDTNGWSDVFVLDRASGVLVRGSVGTSGAQGNASSSGGDVSDDGRYLVFHSDADNLAQGSASPHWQGFLRDFQLGTTELVSVTPAGAPGNSSIGEGVHVSDDGRYVVFVSHASDLVQGDTNGWEDIFLRDRNTASTTRLNLGPGGVECDGMITHLYASADASRIVFEGYATTLVPGTGGGNEIYLLDRPTGALSVISVGPGGLNNDSGGLWPRIADDGRWVIFASSANLDPNTPGGAPGDDAILYDAQTGLSRVVSRSTGGSPGYAPPFTSSPMEPHSVASGGSLVAFHCNRRGLVAGDTNDDLVDVFLWDALSTCPPIESYCFGKVNSENCMPTMTSSGEPHVGGPADAFFLATSDFVHGQIALILWSPSPAAVPFSGGTLCLGGPIVRTPAQHTGTPAGVACSYGTLSFHFSQVYMAARGIQAGLTLHAQAYGRDDGLPPPFPTGLSNGIRFTTAP